MKNNFAFLKKEIMEYTRNYKFLICIIVFALFGIISPLTAKFTPYILKKFMSSQINIILPQPTYIDSWIQFFKNTTQMGLIIIIILFSDMFSKEYSSGTLVNLLTKGLKRRTVVLSKFSSCFLIVTISYWLCFIFCLIYTEIYFKAVIDKYLFLSVFCAYVFFIMILSLIVLFSTIVKSNYGVLLLVGACIFSMVLLNFIPNSAKYNPYSLISKNINILQNNVSIKNLAVQIIISFSITIMSLIAGVQSFKRKVL